MFRENKKFQCAAQISMIAAAVPVPMVVLCGFIANVPTRLEPSDAATLLSECIGRHLRVATEVKTRTGTGWMFFKSSMAWIALMRDGQVVNVDDVWKRAGTFDALPAYLRDSWWAIRGMYRHGTYYPPYFRFPEFNWALVKWLVLGCLI